MFALENVFSHCYGPRKVIICIIGIHDCTYVREYFTLKIDFFFLRLWLTVMNALIMCATVVGRFPVLINTERGRAEHKYALCARYYNRSVCFSMHKRPEQIVD